MCAVWRKRISFSVEGEGEIIGDATISANPRAVSSALLRVDSFYPESRKNKGESPRTV